jgi:hypothetical protein
MNLASIEAVFRALNNAGVRYLVAGGLAVAAHGYLRLTADMDLVIRLDPDNIASAFDALASLGYRPTVPITSAAFSDSSNRHRWIEEKGMQVLNFYSDQHRTAPVDIFVVEPFDFEHEHGQALVSEVAEGIPVRFISIQTLIEMKRLAGRPRDLDDIQHLGWILEDNGQDGPR